MRRLALLAITCFCATAVAPPARSVKDLIALVRAELARGETDAHLARSLRGADLSEQLAPRVLEELESQGAGPKAMSELEGLRDRSRTLPAPSAPLPFETPAPPPPEDRNRIIAAARERALGYSRTLPDFICEQLVRRYQASRRGWDLKDTLTLRLTYFDRKEAYKLLTINRRPTEVPYEAVGGTVTQGEFGSLLLQVFEAGRFEWDHWTTLRRRRTHVYAFRVRSVDSRYTLEYRSAGRAVSALTGQHGYVYIDAGTDSVMRIAADVDTIPSDFPVASSSTLLDYDFTAIGPTRFLLPLRAEVRMATAEIETRNDVSFLSYRKFSAETNITYGDPR